MSTSSLLATGNCRSEELERLWCRHSELYGQVLKTPAMSGTFDSLSSDIEQLLRDVAEFSRTATSLDDYRWAGGTMAAWQSVYSTVLNRPMPDSLLDPERVLVPRLPRIPDSGRTFSHEEFRHLIETIAGTIASTRMSIIGRPSDPNEMRRDWSYAETYLVGEILDGKINMPRRIGSDLYRYLEQIWIKYVKYLWAFFNWVNRGRPLELAGQSTDYRGPCRHLHSLLVNPRMKATQEEFGPVESYIRDLYLGPDGSIDHGKPGLRGLIGKKANRIYGMTRVDNAEQNWLNAEAYVQLYYENIIPAVRTAAPERILRVLKAFQFSKAPENGFRVINCFEVAVAIYFLDPKVIDGFWAASESEELPASHVRSNVLVRSWPTNFKMPARCAERCAWRDGWLHFRGVMTHGQRDALIACLHDQEQIGAVNRLFNQSRLIHRETTL